MTDPTTHPDLMVGERIRLGAGRKLWTVQAVSPNFAAIVRQRPFMRKGELFYAVIDWRQDRRGPCNLVGQGYGDGSYSRDECAVMLDEFETGELEASSRNWVALEPIERVEPGDPSVFLDLGAMVQRLANRGLILTASDLRDGLDILALRGLEGEDARTSLMSLLLRITPFAVWHHPLFRDQEPTIFRHGTEEAFMGWPELGRLLTQVTEGLTDEGRAGRLQELFGSDALRPAWVFEAVHRGR